jgi:hypothetical protein
MMEKKAPGFRRHWTDSLRSDRWETTTDAENHSRYVGWPPQNKQFRWTKTTRIWELARLLEMA